MKGLRELLKQGQSDTFCPELFGEWFVDGSLDDSHFKNLTPEQCDDVYESISERYGNDLADKFDNKALPIINV